MVDNVSVAVTVVMLLTTLLLGFSVFQSASAGALEYTGKADEWCEERDGRLYNAQVIGDHGGLHCELPNGTTVHMHEIITVTESNA